MGSAPGGVNQGAQIRSFQQAAGSLGEKAAQAFQWRKWHRVEEVPEGGRDGWRRPAVWEGRCWYLSQGSGEKLRAGLERRPGRLGGQPGW